MMTDGGRTNELRAVARVQLGRLEKQLADALPKAKDPSTVAHLEDSLAQVRKALDAKK